MFQRYSFDELLKILKSKYNSSQNYVFDCDGTLLDGDVSTTTGWLLMRNGLVDQERIPPQFRSESFYLNMNLLDFERVRAEVERTLGISHVLEWEILIQAGLPHDQVRDYSQRALDEALKHKWVTMGTMVPQVLREFKDQAWIVSGSSRPTVQAFAERMGVDRTRVIATELEVLDGIYQARFAEPGFIWQEGKANSLRKVGIEPYFVAGDSIGDWHMMEMASDWVWCVMWYETRFGAKRFRTLLEENLPFGKEIPKEPGLYVYSGAKSWIFEVKSSPSHDA